MNPSANGWINKLLNTLELSINFNEISTDAFYLALRQSGFIYGNNVLIVENLIEKFCMIFSMSSL